MSRAETDGFDAFYHALSVTAAACVAVALVVGGVTALRRPIPVENLTGGSGFVAGGPVRFIPLRALGTPIGFDSPAWNQNVLPRVRAVATVQDDRAVLTWQLADGTVLMGAVSLPSGQSLFGPVPVGRYESWNLRVMGTGVLVDGIRADAAIRTISWFDRDNGATRWQLDLPPAQVDVVLARSAIIVASLPQGDLRGIDWTTGRTLWTVNDSTGPSRVALGMTTQLDQVLPDPGPATRSSVGSTGSTATTGHRAHWAKSSPRRPDAPSITGFWPARPRPASESGVSPVNPGRPVG